jgi:hypothetical protein
VNCHRSHDPTCPNSQDYIACEQAITAMSDEEKEAYFWKLNNRKSELLESHPPLTPCILLIHHQVQCSLPNPITPLITTAEKFARHRQLNTVRPLSVPICPVVGTVHGYQVLSLLMPTAFAALPPYSYSHPPGQPLLMIHQFPISAMVLDPTSSSDAQTTQETEACVWGHDQRPSSRQIRVNE